MFYVYILQSLKDKRTYTGYSDNLEKRLKEHNQGKVNATKHRRPFILFFKEKCKNFQEVKKREIYWKSGAGRRKLKQMFIKGVPAHS